MLCGCEKCSRVASRSRYYRVGTHGTRAPPPSVRQLTLVCGVCCVCVGGGGKAKDEQLSGF